MTDQLLLSDEVAEKLRVSVETLRTWRYRKQGPKSFKVGRRVVYRESEVLAFIAEAEAAENDR